MKALAAACAFLALFFAGQAAMAQPIDAATRKAGVERVAGLMRNNYVFPDVGAKAATELERALAAGEYDAINDTAAFSERLTTDLRKVAPDGHLRVRGGAAPPPQGPPAAPPPNAEAGIVRADKLDGGIGYLEIVGFPSPAQLKPALDKAMTSLADSRAMILDLRRNGGGSPQGVGYLVSFFLDPDQRTVINVFHNRLPGATGVLKTESVNTRTPVSFAGKPLYVLTSKRTFSGGEEFAYDVQALKLGTLVGETTGGGANGGGTHSVIPGVSIFVPNFQPLHPATGKNWEGTGVVPEIATAPADALKTALEKLGLSPRSGDIAALSTARVFTPRSTPHPASEAATRRAVEGFARGEPPLDSLVPQFAEVVRRDTAMLQERFGPLGKLELVRFMNVSNGLDNYELKFEKGVIGWGIAMDGEGRIAGASFRPLAALTPTEEERMAVFRASDPDGDGRIDKAGYKAVLDKLGFGAQIETLFIQRDVNKDGFVSAEEYRTAIPQ